MSKARVRPSITSLEGQPEEWPRDCRIEQMPKRRRDAECIMFVVSRRTAMQSFYLAAMAQTDAVNAQNHWTAHPQAVLPDNNSTLLAQTRRRVALRFRSDRTIPLLTRGHENFYREQLNVLPN